MVQSLAVVGTLLGVAAVVTAGATNATRGPSNNWAGGMVIEPGKITEAAVDIVVPECTVGTPAYDYVPYSASGWVGIDGNEDCSDVVFQTGFYCSVTRINGTSDVTYYAWTEWYPHPQQSYNDFVIQAGDVVSMKVVAHSKTSGTSYLHNRRTGQKAQTTYTNETTPLCFNDAEWIVESELGFSEGGFLTGERTAGYKPSFEFQNAMYRTTDGKTGKPAPENMFNMVQNGTQVAEAVYEKPGFFQVNDTTPANWNPGN